MNGVANRKLLLYLSFTFVCQSCDWFGGGKTPTPNKLPQFESTPTAFNLVPMLVPEASGIADSRHFPGNIWIQEDGNRPAAVYLYSHTGTYLGKVTLPEENRDWEDIAIGPGPQEGLNYLYIGEIGDNIKQYDDYAIYRFPEPEALDITLEKVEKIRFIYPENQKYNAETLLVDPLTKDIYILTKGELPERIFRLPYPQSTTELNTAELMGKTQLFLLTAGDISADGSEIILKGYDTALYWRRNTNESITQAIERKNDLLLPYVIEPQGEAICFAWDGSGYFTASEQTDENIPPPLRFYKRVIK